MKPDELALSFDLPKRTVALVLAGGRGSRLMNLTDRRAKPAVYFGGKFRIIDFALSNCLNSGIRRIGVITQYKSHSLLRHLHDVMADFEAQGLTRLRGEWLDAHAYHDKPVRVLLANGNDLCGKVVGLDEDGALVLEDAGGQHSRVNSGEVHLTRRVS